MSGQPLPTSNRKDASEGSHAKHKQAEAHEAFFRFRPFACLKHHAGRYHARACKNENGDYLTAAIRLSTSIAVACWPLWAFLAIMFAAVAGRAIANFDRFASDQINAWCTVAIALVAFVQWRTSIRQHQQMVIQNGFIERQTKIAESQVEQMRLEQRAWLSFGRPKMEAMEVGSDLHSTVMLRNSGHTPANIIAANMQIVEIPSEKTPRLVLKDQEPSANAPTRSVVGPGSDMYVQTAKDTPVFTQEMADRVAKGETRLWVISSAYYRDVVVGRLHQSWLCYFYDAARRELFAHTKYNYMD